MLITKLMIKNIIRESIIKYLNESIVKVSKIIFVAFGSESFDINKVKPVDFDGSLTMLRNKPTGGVWASPLISKKGWADWCC